MRDLTYIINIKTVLLLFMKEKNYLPIAPPIRTASRNSGVFLAIAILKINQLISRVNHCRTGKNVVCVKFNFFSIHKTNLTSLIRDMEQTSFYTCV